MNVHLANNKKAILVIHDWGSAVGFEFTRQHPELVEKIVGINSPSLPGMRIQWKTNPVQLISRKDIQSITFRSFTLDVVQITRYESPGSKIGLSEWKIV